MVELQESLFTDKQVIFLQDIIKKEVLKILPSIFEKVTSAMLTEAERTISENQTNLIESIQNSFNKSKDIEIEDVIATNRKEWNDILDKRKDKFWQYYRCISLLDYLTIVYKKNQCIFRENSDMMISMLETHKKQKLNINLIFKIFKLNVNYLKFVKKVI